MKEILSVTGIRSEYDIMSSVYSAIDKYEDMSIKLVVTGAHLTSSYVLTISEIEIIAMKKIETN